MPSKKKKTFHEIHLSIKGWIDQFNEDKYTYKRQQINECMNEWMNNIKTNK